MRYAILIIPIVVSGCVHRPDYQPPPSHPAAVDSTPATPPSAGDPFMVRATFEGDASMEENGHDRGRKSQDEDKPHNAHGEGGH